MGFIPTVVVIDVTIDIRRIAVDQIFRRGFQDCLQEILALENKILGAQQLFHATDLIDNLGYVGLGETLRLPAKRNVEFALPIEPDHPVESRPIQKEKV